MHAPFKTISANHFDKMQKKWRRNKKCLPFGGINGVSHQGHIVYDDSFHSSEHQSQVYSLY